MGWNIAGAKVLEDTIFRLKFDLVKKIGVLRGMSVVDMGCGQGGFTVAVARIVGKHGKVLAVDVSNEYLVEFKENLSKWNVKDIVTFIQADAANLEGVIPNEFADMVVSYRFLEELEHPEDMAKIVKEMSRVVKKSGKVCLIELSTQARNEAEENYVRLHKESGDSFFEPHEILKALKEAKFTKVRLETFETNIWFSPELAKRDLSCAQVWFTADEEKRLGPSIDTYGMKYPALLIFSGVK
jgi:cyclopropane fatty-acyl-phospholipid synthase-like methyltransferase